MGLDMYLHRQTYVQNWPHIKPEDRIEINISGNTKGVNPDQIKYIVEEVGYWRKANAIHSWIVNNCADGLDECQQICMPKQKVEELHQLACFVLGSKDDPNAEQIALENLPPANGFFFGPTEIGDWYWDDIQHTINVLSYALQSDFSKSQIIYQASW